jgi:hypothetical protein
MDVGLF